MKKQLTIFVFLLSFICVNAFAAKDSLEISPNTSGLCCWTLTVKNRNAQALAIEEIRFQITTADGTVFEELKNVAQWAEITNDVTASYTSDLSGIPAGGSKSDFGICLSVSKTDQPINVKWVTYNAVNALDSGTLQFICSPTQSYPNDSVSVVPSVVNNDPHFAFTIYNKNDYAIPIARFAAQLVTPSGGTMRPSKISPPTGWKIDSVTGSFAYFSALSQTDYINYQEVRSGFKVALRGNPTLNRFSFAWFTYDEAGALISRDTVRNIPVTFSGFSTDADSLKALVLNGCLYELTVKNYHVSNTTPISKIRKVVLWRKDASITFTTAPTAPLYWTKTVKADSIIYSAPHDTLGIPGGIVNSQFRFNVDAPLTPFNIGWRTYKTLSSAAADTLSSGNLSLQCQKEAPKPDDATISDAGLCTYLLKVFNEHNQPPSNLIAVKLSIPKGKGKLIVSVSSLNWNKQNETDTSVVMVAPTGGTQGTGETQDFLFSIEPTTPGELFPLRWATYDETALTGGTPLFTGQHNVGCSPVVSSCDVMTRSVVSASDCSYEYSFKNLRDTLMSRVVFEVGNGWAVFTADAPTGWNVQLLNNKTTAEYTVAAALGIPRDSTLGGFIIKYLKEETVGKLDTFNVTVKRYDLKDKECIDVVEHICTSTTVTSVAEPDILSSNVTVYPNPVAGDATLSFSMQKQSRATITVLDLLGRQVKVIGSSILSEGGHEFKFSLKGLEEGSYYLRIQTPNGVVTKKLVYMP
ncbi:MAG TPA: T9SS type A sorting domain-containing protein [Candidatus Kapabacteria bacterium]